MTSPNDAGIGALAGRVAARLAASGGRLVTAESCTGGWVAKACTDLPGSSAWFAGGVVSYSNELKTALLGVPEVTLATHGAVSEAVVRAMAAGALDRLGGTVAVAVSGIAGPDGGTPDKPVGTVWLAWASRRDGPGHVRAECLNLDGDREAVRRAAVARALAGVLEA
jgi:nicotinamide-nucleotide amidase